MEENRLHLGIALDSSCATCMRAISRGVSLTGPNGEELADFCQWCLLIALDWTTGMNISEQVLDWERRRYVFGKRNNRGRFAKDMNHRPGEHSYIMTVASDNIIVTRCAPTARLVKQRAMIPDEVKCRIVQVPDDVQTHMHHDNGDCVPIMAIVTAKGARELVEIASAVARDGGVVTTV